MNSFSLHFELFEMPTDLRPLFGSLMLRLVLFLCGDATFLSHFEDIAVDVFVH